MQIWEDLIRKAKMEGLICVWVSNLLKSTFDFLLVISQFPFDFDLAFYFNIVFYLVCVKHADLRRSNYEG